MFFIYTETEYKLVPGRKRIHRPADSSSDEGGENGDGGGKVSSTSTLTVKEKEERLFELRLAEPEYEPMVCHFLLFPSNYYNFIIIAGVSRCIVS